MKDFELLPSFLSLELKKAMGYGSTFAQMSNCRPGRLLTLKDQVVASGTSEEVGAGRYSPTVAAAAQAGQITWGARGSYAREKGIKPHAGYAIPLAETRKLSIDQLRAILR